MDTQKYATLEQLSKTQFRRYTGLHRENYDKIVLLVKRHNLTHKKKVGRPANLIEEDQVLLLLEYYRENRTYFHLGVSYGLSESNVQRTIERIEAILIKSGQFTLEGKKALLSDKHLKTIIIDVTETPAQRPKKKRKNKKKVKRSCKQKRKYSGKKKCHTHKIQVVMDADTHKIICVHVEKGSCHDFNLYKKTQLHIHPNIKVKVDSGYQGTQKLHQNTDLPQKKSKKKPLSKTQKQQNRKFAKERIYVEHANAKLKVFKLLKNHYRSHSRFGLRATLIAAFVNLNAA